MHIWHLILNHILLRVIPNYLLILLLLVLLLKGLLLISRILVPIRTAHVSAVELGALLRLEYLGVVFQFLPAMALNTAFPKFTLPVVVELGLVFCFPVRAFDWLVVV